MLRTARGWVAFRAPSPATGRGAECRRLRAAAEAASRKLAALAGDRSAAIGGEVSAILSAHALIALDPDFLKPIEKMIRREQINAEWSLRFRAEELKSEFGKLSDSACVPNAAMTSSRSRARSRPSSPGPPNARSRLSPWTAARSSSRTSSRRPGRPPRPAPFHRLALERGGIHSHAAIIARSFGLPAVVGVAGLLDLVAKSRPIIVDGDRGTVEPTRRKSRSESLRARPVAPAGAGEEGRSATSAPPARPTASASRFERISSSEGKRALEPSGAEGIGLFRSEFLSLDVPGGSPGVEEQQRVYETARPPAEPHPVVVRTYDLGGEKEFGAPATGPLGLRGIRYSLAHPGMFRDQLRALLRASTHGDLRILLPMVSDVGEVREARRHLAEVAGKKGSSGFPRSGRWSRFPRPR